MLRLRLLTALLLRRDACWKNSFLLTVATKSVLIFIFWSRCCCCCCVLLLLLLRAAAAAAHNISTEAERGTGYCFLLLRLRYFYCCFLCVYSIAVPAFEKGYMPGKTNKKYYFFFFGGCDAAALHSSTGICSKNKIGFCFLFDTGTQPIAFSVTGYVLLLFLTAPGSCVQNQYSSRERYRLLFLPSTFLSFTLRSFGRLLLLLFLAASFLSSRLRCFG